MILFRFLYLPQITTLIHAVVRISTFLDFAPRNNTADRCAPLHFGTVDGPPGEIMARENLSCRM